MNRIFISSVQKEFEAERAALGEFIAGDALLGKLFGTFVFERDVPASDRCPDEVYLEEVARCDLYLGLFGDEYGWENADGLSPTHLEFNEATRLGKPRLIFVQGADDQDKQPKMQSLIREAGNQLIRRRFSSIAELHAAVYASLVSHLEATGIIRSGPWDAAAARNATLDDLDHEAIARFVRRARKARHFPLPETADPEEVLTHLNLLVGHLPTHAAVLLFGHKPQRFTLPSEVKCAHFHGTEVAKPIPSYQVYKGTAFELVDQAVDFVLSKIDLAVGTRAESTDVPVSYEIPIEVVREAIVNAVAHRDYSSTASVQVMLFADRLEVWNPGTLPPSLTLQNLREHHASFPANPLLAEALYLARYIERLGTGTGDMIQLCSEAGLAEPEFALTDGFVVTIFRPRPKSTPPVTPPVTGQVTDPVSDPVTDPVSDPVSDPVTGQVTAPVDRVVLALVSGALAPSVLQTQLLGLSHRPTFRKNYLRPALKAGLVEPTIPGKPTSKLQKYRLTERGKARFNELQREGS